MRPTSFLAKIGHPARCWSGVAVAMAFGWAFWPTIRDLERIWSEDPRYSHGYLVPIFAIYLLYTRRERLSTCQPRPSTWGLAMIAASMVIHVGGAATNHQWVEAASLMPALASLCVLLLGWKALTLAWPSIAFLVFMIPLPYRVEVGLGGPLQTMAARASTFVIQAMGYPALEEGNVITLEHSKLGVIEACNGLSMLTFFFAISVGFILVVRRPVIERALIIAGAVPIALIANVARITATGVLLESVGHGVAGVDFHDLAGYLMMPLALALLLAESHLIAHLVVVGEVSDDRAAPSRHEFADPDPRGLGFGGPKAAALPAD